MPSTPQLNAGPNNNITNVTSITLSSMMSGGNSSAASGSAGAGSSGSSSSTNAADAGTQISTFRSYVSMLTDPACKDENKLKAAQAVSEDLEGIALSSNYGPFLEHSIVIFLKILNESEPQFIAEHHQQQLRKLVLEMIHRLPSNEYLKPHLKPILALCFRLLRIDNEENVMVALRIIIELHKTFRPQFTPETAAQIREFLTFVKSMYSDLPNHLTKIFEPRQSPRVADLSEVNLERLLNESFAITPIHTEKKQNDDTPITYNLIPRAVLSLKVLTELPIIVVLLLQLYKEHVYQEVVEFIPLIMNTITIQPIQRENENFNKEVFVDLIAAQIKILSFLAYIIKTFQDRVVQHCDKLVQGMLQLLTLCPSEVAHLRKELLIATKHILALELRVKFVPHIDRLFDENLLFGSGWTAHETLRPLAYSTLADLVHHVRSKLNLHALTRAVHLFSKNIHDETLPTSIQTMSCKLLLNLVECITNYNQEDSVDPGVTRDLLIRMLQVFVDKFKTIAQLQVPYLKKKHAEKEAAAAAAVAAAAAATAAASTANSNGTPMDVDQDVKQEDTKDTKIFGNQGAAFNAAAGQVVADLSDVKDKEQLLKIGCPPNVTQNYSVPDCKALVKTLVSGVKTITWGCTSKFINEQTIRQDKVFQPKEVLIYIRFVKWAMQALDIYTINVTGAQPTTASGRGATTATGGRSKEEKEVLEHFAGVFTRLSPSTFREIFSTTIDYVVDRIHINSALQGVANTFLANLTTSPVFATILVEYLLKHMEEMGTPVDRSGLYLKLFKLVFGSVSLFAAQNELMLKPHLHQIVNKSMDLAMSAKEPYNYFLLLRALFRSIGGGSHDLLYQEFLPLLPTLLQGLNSLQSGLHKQHMKDLFVELCLTVPVRLSSLLPYLPMLMDPLVSALNGSQTLISQGLRTLELCVDNLQPDFLYEHIQPVRAELMQALWKTLRNPNDATAAVAFRVLGKFGGGNRKMMIEPQKLQYEEQEAPSTCINIQFAEHRTPIVLPVEKIIEVAFNALKTSTTEPWYRQQCWEAVRCFILGSMLKDQDRALISKLITHPSFKDGPIATGESYICRDDAARRVHQTALTAMLVAAAIKELSKTVLPSMVAIVRHYTMVAVVQQAGPFNVKNKIKGMDPMVLVDALAVVMGHEEKELCKPGHFTLVLIISSAADILGSRERASQLPLMEYISVKMCQLCYQRAWYAKLGGCLSIKVLFENMTLKWVLQHQFAFLRAFMYVMMDLTEEVSTGAVDMAKTNLEKMLQLCASPLQPPNDTPEMKTIQDKSLHEVTQELVLQITSSNLIVREQTMQSLRTLGKLTGRGVTEVMLPHKEVLVDMIPPKKHLLRHQPANVQIGLMEGNTFCTTLEPRLFTLDTSIQEHKVFLNELVNLVESDENVLRKYSCYKNVLNITPLKKSALRALSACHYIPNIQEKIFNSIHKALLTSTNNEILETAFEGLKKIMSGNVPQETINAVIRPIIVQVCSMRLTTQVVSKLSYTTQLYPKLYSENICHQLLQTCFVMLDSAASNAKNLPDLKLAASILVLFHRLPAVSSRNIEKIVTKVLEIEQALLIEAGSPLREPLLKFLIQFPSETLGVFMSTSHGGMEQWCRYLEYVVRHPLSDSIRDELENCGDRLYYMLTDACPNFATSHRDQLHFFALRLVLLITRNNSTWLGRQDNLLLTIRNLWNSEEFHKTHHKCDSVEYSHWKIPRMVVSILLSYFKSNPNDISLLFELMKAFIGRFIPEFQFLREFLGETVAKSYSPEWKRQAFSDFVLLFEDVSVEQELKANILQYIIIPSFSASFERGEGDLLISNMPTPDIESPNNIVSVFINRVMNPDDKIQYTDSLRILLLQLSCLLVDKASTYFHDETTRRQGVKLRRLMTFAWPCLLAKNCVDPATKYHGHLLLSHIIAKFAINKRIVLQVFISLLKAHAMEARTVVRQALEILTPAMPQRMEDGNTMLTHWTRKILVEEGHSIGQLVHILQLVVRHVDVYQPVRQHLVHHITSAMHKLGFSITANMDQKRLAVDLAEVCIKWEEKRVADEKAGIVQTVEPRAKGRGLIDQYRPAIHADTVVYFLVRLPCQVHENVQVQSNLLPNQNIPVPIATAGELLSRRCFALLRRALVIWPTAEPKLVWLDKLFQSLETPQFVLGNVCAGIDLLTFLVSKLKKEQMLAAIKSMYRGLLCCCNSNLIRVVKPLNNLLNALLKTFGLEELDELIIRVVRVVQDSLANYDRGVPATSGATLYPVLNVMRTVSQYTTQHVDRLMGLLMKVLQRVTRDHIQPPQPDAQNQQLTECLILLMDLLKNRACVMTVEMRKVFIGNIMVGLIEKTPDVKVMKVINKTVGDWVRCKSAVNQAPSLREKSILLVKLMQYVEKRFPDDADMMAQFLNLVNFVYRDETLRTTELVSKLEVSFLTGLRSNQPLIRASFFQVFHESMPNKLHSRLLYIVCSQNWDNIGYHYWIKQCIQMLLITAQEKTPIQNSNTEIMLPSISSVLGWADPADRAVFSMLANIKEEEVEPNSANTSTDTHQEDIDMELSSSVSADAASNNLAGNKQNSAHSRLKVLNLLAAQWKFYMSANEIHTTNFLAAAAQLCHMDTSLAEWMWRQLFPRIWSILTERQQQSLSKEIPSFLASGSNINQKECHPSAIKTFVEALCLCQPSVPLKPALLKYLGKNHNLWHRMTMQLENLVMPSPAIAAATLKHDVPDPILTPQQDALFCLNDMYSQMKEEDLWAGLWQTHAHYHETKLGVTYEQHGFMEQAVSAYELGMSKMCAEMAVRTVPFRDNAEAKVWELHWIRCTKELNQWEMVKEYGQDMANGFPNLVLESAWRLPDWNAMKDALSTVEKSAYAREFQWRLNLYRGYTAICHPDEQHLNIVEKCVEIASTLCIKEWKRLPSIVSHIHLPYLQAAQQVMELQEACQIHQGLNQNRANSLHDMKAFVKTWRNRLPVIADDLSHWSDIFTWRQHHYQFIVTHYTEAGEGHQQGNSMLGVHASAQAIIHFGKIARKHNLTNVCLESLSRIHSIPSVPIVDCFQKIRQQVKCYLHMAVANNMGKTELQEGLEVIESTNLKFFTKEMTAEFYALKGLFLSHLARSEDANRALSASVQFHDSLVKGWALWGDYLESAFTRDSSNLTIANYAITCFLQASRSENEAKARKYLAKVFWLLSFESEGSSVLSESVEKYSVGVPAMQWLAWIPQLLTCLVRSEGKVVQNLLNQVGKLFPQAVYLPVRTLYLTLRIEQRGRHKRDPATQHGNQPPSSSDTIRATEPMLRCSRILQIQRDFHPTVLVSLEGIVDQMMWFRENWYEEVLRQLRQALAKCYSVAFENSAQVSDAVITPHTQSFVKKLVATFGLGVENISNSGAGVSAGSSTPHYTSTGSESLARRAQATVQDPVFHKMKGQFTADFDFAQPGSVKLHNLIHKLKKWIKILEARVKLLPKTFLIEDKCRFLSNFSLQTAEVELPGEFLLPKNSRYYIRIARFLPKVDIVQKHGSAPRRLHIRGHNGRVYPYLVVSDSSLSDSRREERLQQLLRMMNLFFTKQKETSRRFIHLYVSRVVAFCPQNRLVEDNLSSLSLLDIYRQQCQAKALEPDTPITRYYERLAGVQARGSQASHQVLRDIVKEVQGGMVPRTMLTEWAVTAFPNATHYWTFRKMVTVQLGVLGLMEYVLHLTRLFPEMLYLHQDSGLINVAYFKFNMDDSKGELDGSRPVPFRLTPNLAELCTSIGVTGPLTASMIVSARCLATPSFKLHAILRAILRDEIIAWHKRQESAAESVCGGMATGVRSGGSSIEAEALVSRVNKAVNGIMARLSALAVLDQTESKATQMVRAVLCVDNLCRMDPAWHPWL
uniref:Transformation/transcription domain-associated protein-like n=6 Tax=Hirondellea gigas TaxID=1518452 RepID=A0A6A7FXF6_9CRUS